MVNDKVKETYNIHRDPHIDKQGITRKHKKA